MHFPLHPALPLTSRTPPHILHPPSHPALPLTSRTPPCIPHSPSHPALPLTSRTPPHIPHSPSHPSLPLTSGTLPHILHSPSPTPFYLPPPATPFSRPPFSTDRTCAIRKARCLLLQYASSLLTSPPHMSVPATLSRHTGAHEYALTDLSPFPCFTLRLPPPPSPSLPLPPPLSPSLPHPRPPSPSLLPTPSPSPSPVFACHCERSRSRLLIWCWRSMKWRCRPTDLQPCLAAIAQLQEGMLEARIKEGPKADLEPYLAAIAQLEESVRCSEVLQPVKGAWQLALSHSQALLKEAHHRLNAAFKQQLQQFTKAAHPAKLAEAIKQAESEGNGLPVLLANRKAGERIRQLAEALIRIGRANKCLKIYTNVRGAAVKAGFKRMNCTEELTREQMDCMVWTDLETRVEGLWKPQISMAVDVVFKAERALCETVLAGLEPHSSKAFADLADLTLGMLFGFGEVVVSQRMPVNQAKELMDMFETLLKMYETMRALIPQVEVVFAGTACDAIRSSAQQLLQRLATASKDAFNNFELAVASDENYSMPRDGTRHALTSHVVNNFNYLNDGFQPTMQSLFGAGSNIFSDNMKRAFAVLYTNLVERKSKQYDNAALSEFFLMNNAHYIVERVINGNLKDVVGEEWIYQQRGIVEKHAKAYLRMSWRKIFELLKPEGPSEEGMEGIARRNTVKEKFRVFNATFEELHRTQCMWKIPDPKLQSALQQRISKDLLPAYRSFLQRCT
ncbi:unnamed protein product [Closterium sp. Naga37s-1]|nr:unnamed protein product [Closterium sp. Naga37s-1]